MKKGGKASLSRPFSLQKTFDKYFTSGIIYTEAIHSIEEPNAECRRFNGLKDESPSQSGCDTRKIAYAITRL